MANQVNTMPYNRDAEMALLGCFLIDSDIAAELVEKLTEDDFYQESHKYILHAMQSVFNARKPVDLVTVSDELDGEQALEKAGVFCEETEKTEKREITKLDLYEDGLSGKPDSDTLRKKLLKHLDLPERLTSNALVQVLNTFLTFEEYKTAIEEITNG